MYCRPLALGPALVAAGLTSAAVAEPTASECKEAEVFFANVLNPKAEANPTGIGWALMPAPVDYYSLSPADQWRELVLRFEAFKLFEVQIKQGKEWYDGINPEFRSSWAESFLMDDTLELCLRPVALAESPELQSEVEEFDAEFSPDARATLRPLMKASQ